MKRIKMYSKDGGSEIEVLPCKVEEMINKGWLKELAKKIKSNKEDK